jgi:hypothetical protein
MHFQQIKQTRLTNMLALFIVISGYDSGNDSGSKLKVWISARYRQQEPTMELWEFYKTSVFLCHQPLGNQVDFAIISAQNPNGNLYHLHHNLTLDREFESHLNYLHLPYRTMIGASPDLTFQEHSFAVLCDKASAIDLALMFEQNAIYWVEAGQLYLVPALLRQNEEYLGLYSERQIVVE